MLLARELSCAPHVVSRLVTELNADALTICEVAGRLTSAQRRGLRPLPNPLPLVPAIARAFHDLLLPSRDRDLLLALAVSLDGRLEPLLDFDGRSAAEISAAPVGHHLVVRAGRVRFADSRLGIWLRARTSAVVIGAVHDRLSVTCRGLGDAVGADWHRARASFHGEPETAAELTRIARELSEAGFAERAHLLAQEAAQHAEGADRDEAHLVAGASSVGGGFVTEAAAWLGSLYPDGLERYRLQGLAGLIIARSHLHGSVPDVDPASLRPRTDDREDWYAWTRAAAVAAVLCAERGDRPGMRAWLDALREGAALVGAERELRDPVVALSWLIAGERDFDDAAGAGPLSGRMLQALRAALGGDVTRGLRLLGAAGETMDAEVDPLVAGFEHSPVVHAYRAVVEVLLLVWRGDIGLARERLILAALDLPIAMPFAGLGVVLARRLDLAVLGELGPIALSLTGALPPGLRIDLLLDRGIESFLAGDFDDAATSVRLWLDLGAPQTALSVPGLDEVALAWEVTPGRPGIIAPADVFLAHELRIRIATTSDGRWRTDREEIHSAARTLRSPFARGRVEAMLGIQSAIRDERGVARRHLRDARRLFEVAGATAWARSVTLRLERMDLVEKDGDLVDPLDSCRHAWSQILTPREVEVAMLAVGGAGNRDIAATLSVSVRTVEVHLGRIFSKLDVRKRVELTALAHRTNQHL